MDCHEVQANDSKHAASEILGKTPKMQTQNPLVKLANNKSGFWGLEFVVQWDSKIARLES